MADLTIRVVRPDDLLVAEFAFVNMALGPATDPMRQVVRVRQDEPAFLVVHLPPQHVADEALDDNSTAPLVAQTRALLSGPSRLAFRVPASSIPLRLDALLDWSTFEAILAPEPVEPAEPGPLETAIELPYRLVIAPRPGGRWEHRKRPPEKGGRAELWHTRYHTGLPEPDDDFDIAAVWTPDLPDPPDQDPVPLSLQPGHRVEIVRMSSDRRLLLDSSYQGLTPALRKEVELARASHTGRIVARNLVLSALGGWLEASSMFTFPTLSGELLSHTDLSLDIPFGADLFSLAEWTHTTVMGRDHYVRTVQRGFLYPFGHRAHRIAVSERRLRPSEAGDQAAYVMLREVLVIQEPEKRYDDRAMPFVSVRIASQATRSGTGPVAIDHTPTTRPFVVRSGGQPYAFPMIATDRAGHAVPIAAPMVFVPANVTDLRDAAALYEDLGPVGFGGHPLTYLDDPQREPAGIAAEVVPDRATLVTMAMSFGADAVTAAAGHVGFTPVMAQAQVRLPAAEQMLGAGAPAATIAFTKAYVENTAVFAANQVFADIVGGMPLSVPADKAGGLLAPSTTLSSVSLTDGAFPDVSRMVDKMIAEAPPDVRPADVLKLVIDQVCSGKLLGVIELRDIVDTAIESLGLDGMPKLTMEREGSSQRIEMTWTPKLNKERFAKPLRKLRDDPTLTVRGTMTRPVGDGLVDGALDGATTAMSGELTNLGITFLDAVEIDLARVRFSMGTGQDPDFDPTVTGFRFTGDLSFIEKLACKLNFGDFGGANGPPVAITPAGVTVSIAVPLPSISVGLFSLMNLAFTAKLTVLFSDSPATITVGLSSPQNPFLISYWIFGGGGYLALTAGTDGRIRVDAALEFGGVLAFSITLAKGIVQAMVGILFSMDGDRVLLGGYCRIYGCVEIMELVTISVEFYLSLTYDGKFAVGSARVTVMVSLLGLAKSVTLETTRKFSTKSHGQSLAGAESFTLDQWRDYCDAYA
jgi:hypothetical protein